MASITFAEASKLGLNDLSAGVIESIVTSNQMYNVLPFDEIFGNALAYNRENVLGDAQALGLGGTITAKGAASYSQVTTALTTIVGDAEVDARLIAQGVGGNAGNDLVAAQIASKAKSVGREFQRMLIAGDSAVAGEFDGLKKLVQAGQKVAGGVLTFEMLDELLHLVKSKDGEVDALVMNAREIRKLRALQRALGGTSGDEVSVNGIVMPAYAGIPVLRNDWIEINTDASDVYAVNFDDGSRKTGIAGLIDTFSQGVQVENVGPMETKDQHIFRVKMYGSFALFSNLGAAMIEGVTSV